MPLKKIMLILPHTGSGGDTQVIYNLLFALPPSSFKFYILAYQRGELHADFTQFGHLYTFPVDDTNWARRLLRRFSMPVFKGLKQWYGRYLIQKIEPDVVYINTVNENEFSRAALRSGRKLIVHIHEMGFVVTQRMRAEWIENLLRSAEAIISPAQAVTEFYRDVYGIGTGKMHLVHETVSDNRLRSDARQNSWREKLGLEKDVLLIGSVGSVIYRKGVDTFLRTCSIIREKVPDREFAFVWLGGQPGVQEKQSYFQALQKSIQRENLASQFLMLPHSNDIGNFYSHLDMFVLPSRMEAFPLVVLEALLAEKPVVAMDVAGVREVIDTETGYLVKDRTPEGLAEGILYFLESEERRKVAGQKGRQRVLERFEAEVQAPKWLAILENL